MLERDCEDRRIQALQSLAVVDAGPEAFFDELAHLVARVCDVPSAAIALFDERCFRVRSSWGLEARGLRRSSAFYDWTTRDAGVTVVPDTLADSRFAESVRTSQEPQIRFFAGAPLLGPAGAILGAVCILDRAPRTLDDKAVRLLEDFARTAVRALELRREASRAEFAESVSAAASELFAGALVTISSGGCVTSWNAKAERTFGWTREEVIGRPAPFLAHAELRDGERLRASIADGETVRELRAHFVRKDGTQFAAHVSATALRDRTGAICGAAFAVEDIGEQVRAEEVERMRYDILELVANDAPFETILHRLVERAEYSVPGAMCTLLLMEENRISVAASGCAISKDFLRLIDGAVVGPDVGTCGRAVATGETVVTADIATDPLWLSLRDEALGFGLRACWSTPVRTGNGPVVGTLALYLGEPSTPSAEQLHLLHETGHLVAIAIENRDARVRLEEAALRDPLTGLPNRKLFEDRLRQALANAKRKNAKLALGFLDLNRFKEVNDNLGHGVGDLLLREVAARLLRSVRPQDTIARMGGDEFLVLLTDVDDREAARAIGERILQTVGQSFAPGGHEIPVSASLGLGLFPDDAVEAGQLMRVADRAMYDAKGRCEPLAFPDTVERAGRPGRPTFETELRLALERGEFELLYQPRVSLTTRTVLGAEALLRWHHPLHGLLAPDTFIDVAEDLGLTIALGEWVLRDASRFASRWRKAGGAGSVSVNVSPRQFEDRGFVETVVNALRESDLAPSFLWLEITEAHVMRSPESAATTLGRLSRLGVRSAIDDFGTGYTSLNHLKRLPVAALKIDRALLDGLGVESEPQADGSLVRAIIGMAAALGLDTVAEGVEFETQARLLQRFGCDLAQGYLFSVPIGAEQLLGWPGAAA